MVIGTQFKRAQKKKTQEIINIILFIPFYTGINS